MTLDYHTCDRQWRETRKRKLYNNTRLVEVDGGLSYGIKLHSTIVLKFYPDGRIVFNTGGWHTVTTKERFNRYSPASVWSNRGTWMLGWAGETYLYQDGITLHTATGLVTDQGTESAATLEKQYRKSVLVYAKGYLAALQTGKVTQPDGGDCFMCRLPPNAAGEGHIRSHVDEGYYVPSLVFNAMKAMGASIATQHNVACYMTDQRDKLFAGGGFVDEGIQRAIRKFVLRESGLAF